MATQQRYVADCRKIPSESNCSLLIAGTEKEVLDAVIDHAVKVHRHQRGPELEKAIRQSLAGETTEGGNIRNRELAHAAYDAFNRRDFDWIESRAASGFTMTIIATGELFRGPKGLRTYVESWARAFPDARVELGRVTADDESYVAEFTGTGTHKGPLVSPAGTIQPTGRRLNLRFVESVQVRDGRMVEGHAYFDVLTLLSQLGVAPTVQPAPIEQAQGAVEHPRH